MDKFVNPFEVIAELLGLKKKGPLSKAGIPTPPDTDEIMEAASKGIEMIASIKEIPKALGEQVKDANESFREADKTFRGLRLKGK